MIKNTELKILIMVCLVVVVCGCVPEPTISMQQERSPSEMSATQVRQSRIQVERLGVFEDGLAYGNRRGVYVIKDTKTGKEYIGVSGIGISETGSHYVGVVGKGGHRVEHEQ